MNETWALPIENASLSNLSLASLVTGDSVCLCLDGRVLILGSNTALTALLCPFFFFFFFLRRLAGRLLSKEFGPVHCNVLSPPHHLAPAALDIDGSSV